MLLKLLQNKKSALYIVLLLVLFVAIRAFESVLFYDPLLIYYKLDFQNCAFPAVDNLKLILNLAFRYFLNAVLSVLLLWVLFKDKSLVRFTSVLFIILLLFLLLLFLSVLYLDANNSKMLLFYIRRFIIQPIFILIFIPAFWYQKNNNHK